MKSTALRRRYGHAGDGLLRKGTVVHTHDAGAARWGRPVEKREGRGKVVDHFRDMAGRKTPPYLVRFEDGTTSWYDVDEVSSGGHGHARGPMPRVEYDGQVYALRNRSTVVPDLTAMTRSAVLIWLNQNTVPRGRLRENPLAGLAGVIGVSSGGREVKPR